MWEGFDVSAFCLIFLVWTGTGAVRRLFTKGTCNNIRIGKIEPFLSTSYNVVNGH